MAFRWSQWQATILGETRGSDRVNGVKGVKWMFLIFRTVRWKTISSFNQGDSCIWSDVHAAFSSVLDWYERKGQHVDNILWNVTWQIAKLSLAKHPMTWLTVGWNIHTKKDRQQVIVWARRLGTLTSPECFEAISNNFDTFHDDLRRVSGLPSMRFQCAQRHVHQIISNNHINF